MIFWVPKNVVPKKFIKQPKLSLIPMSSFLPLPFISLHRKMCDIKAITLFTHSMNTIVPILLYLYPFYSNWLSTFTC